MQQSTKIKLHDLPASYALSLHDSTWQQRQIISAKRSKFKSNKTAEYMTMQSRASLGLQPDHMFGL